MLRKYIQRYKAKRDEKIHDSLPFAYRFLICSFEEDASAFEADAYRLRLGKLEVWHANGTRHLRLRADGVDLFDRSSVCGDHRLNNKQRAYVWKALDLDNVAALVDSHREAKAIEDAKAVFENRHKKQ